jgi:hypothetical protein
VRRREARRGEEKSRGREIAESSSEEQRER